MVFWAVAVVILGVGLKLIAAEPGSMILLPLAAVASIYHVIVHREAARSPNPPIGAAAISDILILGGLLLQIDFGSYNCGHTTIDGVSWIFGWSSEKRCTLITGLPAVLLDVAFYIPAAVSWGCCAPGRVLARLDHPRSMRPFSTGEFSRAAETRAGPWPHPSPVLRQGNR